MIKAALVRRGQGVVLEKCRETEAEGGPSHVLDRIAGLINDLRNSAPDYDIAGIGIGAPGAINWERTVVYYPPNLPGWEIVDLRAELSGRLGRALPVLVENDANLAGLGSAHYGAGSPYDAFIMITLGTGVGGAIIYENKIFRGTTGAAGEIGHVSIDFEGPVDRYGIAGALEAYMGQRFLSRYARYKLLSRPESLVHQWAGDDLIDLTPRMLHEAASQGDELAQEILGWAGQKLACGLAACVNLLDIRKFVIGGGVSAAGDFILEPCRKAILKYVMPSHREGLEIIRETLGNEVGILGAAHLVFQYLDERSVATVSAVEIAK